MGINQLKKLKATIALFDSAQKRGWTRAQIEEIANRLVTSSARVRIETFGDYDLDETATLDALDELEESGEADYLFQRLVHTNATEKEDRVPGTSLTKEQVAKLSPQAKLALGNRLEEAKRARKN